MIWGGLAPFPPPVFAAACSQAFTAAIVACSTNRVIRTASDDGCGEVKAWERGYAAGSPGLDPKTSGDVRFGIGNVK